MEATESWGRRSATVLKCRRIVGHMSGGGCFALARCNASILSRKAANWAAQMRSAPSLKSFNTSRSLPVQFQRSSTPGCGLPPVIRTRRFLVSVGCQSRTTNVLASMSLSTRTTAVGSRPSRSASAFWLTLAPSAARKTYFKKGHCSGGRPSAGAKDGGAEGCQGPSRLRGFASRGVALVIGPLRTAPPMD